MNEPILFLFALTCLAIAFGLGWETAVRNYRARYRRLEERLANMRKELEQATEAYSADPARAGITAGQEYVLTAIEQVCAMLRAEIPGADR